MTRRDLLDLTAEELATVLQGLGEPAYRFRQVWRWVFQEKAERFNGMTDLPLPFRRKLASHFTIGTMRVADRKRSERDGTTRYLLRLADGQAVESVLMLDRGRSTACISSQVGCAMGCAFCATGRMGFARNLAPSEIVEQVLILSRACTADDHPSDEEAVPRTLTNVVFMGMGEPLLNLKAVLAAARAMTDPTRLGMSPRRLTLSTCGIVPAIRRLADLRPKYGLALSLNSPFDDERSRLMPVNKRYNLASVLGACEEFVESGGRLTLEYVMLHGVNDSVKHARALTRIAQRVRSRVNLIAYNHVPDTDFEAPDSGDIRSFRSLLQRAGVRATVRLRRGRDVEAACGQLRGECDNVKRVELQRVQSTQRTGGLQTADHGPRRARTAAKRDRKLRRRHGQAEV